MNRILTKAEGTPANPIKNKEVLYQYHGLRIARRDVSIAVDTHQVDLI